MGSVGRKGQYLVTRITTGPQDLLLMLDLVDERITGIRLWNSLATLLASVVMIAAVFRLSPTPFFSRQ